MSQHKILIVEDDDDIRHGYHLLLKARGYDTFFAVDGLSALSEARTHNPGLIILDLGLPAGDGFVVLERLRANIQLSLIPVIVVSGRIVAGNMERALRCGAEAFLQKPVETNELLALIAQIFGEGERSTSTAVTAKPAAGVRGETDPRQWPGTSSS
jgi:DNA-binding response OmpR family regulator